MPLVFISTRWLPHQQMDSEDFNFVFFFVVVFFLSCIFSDRNLGKKESVRAGSGACHSGCSRARRWFFFPSACVRTSSLLLFQMGTPNWKTRTSLKTSQVSQPTQNLAARSLRELVRGVGRFIYLFIFYFCPSVSGGGLPIIHHGSHGTPDKSSLGCPPFK